MGELLISLEDLASIQPQRERRAAELEAARIQASDSSESFPRPVLAMPAPLTEAERFAAAVLEMPANVRGLFYQEDLVSPRTSWESDEERAERNLRTDLGCWCG